MTVLPEPKPAATTAGQPTPDEALRRAAQIAAAVDDVYQQPTSFRDDSLPDKPTIGTARPVAQPDNRIVPSWAVGIAVASIGVGAGITGVGCGAWLVLQGLSSVTLNGVLMVTLPFAGLAMVVTAVGGLFKSARGMKVTHHYEGPVYQDQRNVESKNFGVWAKNNNQS